MKKGTSKVILDKANRGLRERPSCIALRAKGEKEKRKIAIWSRTGTKRKDLEVGRR